MSRNRPLPPNRPVLAIDPGRAKCGLAVVARPDGVEAVETVSVGALEDSLAKLVLRYSPGLIVLGDGTSHKDILQSVRESLPDLDVILYPEAFTTLEGRTLYFEHNPPTGWRRLLPRFLLLPDEGIDGYAAVALALRYFARPEDARATPAG